MESRSVLRLIRYHWAVIAVCAILGIVGGQVLALVTPREYTSSADVLVTVTGGTSTGEIAQSGNFSQQQARNFSAIATREVVLQPVITDLELDLTINQLRRKVSSSVPLNTSIITISATDGSPTRAAAIANSVATYLAEVVPALTPKVDGESPVRLQIIESATAPKNPSAPNVPLLLIIGLFVGLVAAAGIVVFRGIIDARVRTKDDVTEITGAPVLGSIAYDRRAAKKPMALAADRQSLRSEEYRLLRANLRFLQTGQTQRLFVFTSSVPGEGKSSTAANAAAALAASGLSVCLVEADLRRPSLASILDLPTGLGLTSVLMGDVALDDALMDWGTDDMKVLLSGPLPPNPSELLESTTTLVLLQSIKQRFDVTIIDSPPLNPVSDAAVLARTLGGVVMIVGASRARVRELRRAMDRLAAVGAHIEGAVLNLSRSSDSRRYRYNSHSSAAAAGVTALAEAPAVLPGAEVAAESFAPSGARRSSSLHDDDVTDAATADAATLDEAETETETVVQVSDAEPADIDADDDGLLDLGDEDDDADEDDELGDDDLDDDDFEDDLDEDDEDDEDEADDDEDDDVHDEAEHAFRPVSSSSVVASDSDSAPRRTHS